MHHECSECKQKFDMEPGFWYGTGYVSYASFLAWWLILGFSLRDNSLLWWLGINALLLVILQPWIMRLSRTIYLYFFVRYDDAYETSEPKKFDY
jgi:hypothetical protein